MRRCQYSDAADCSECLEPYCPMDAIDDVLEIIGIPAMLMKTRDRPWRQNDSIGSS